MSFPDLRLHRAGMRDEGFWPSFTDIMTVIVMIFLMAMLGLLLRNMDLVTQLQSALKEAQQATQQIATTSSANQDLMAQLAQREHDLEMLRAQMMDLSGQKQRLEQQQLKLRHQHDALTAKNQRDLTQLASQTQQIATMQAAEKAKEDTYQQQLAAMQALSEQQQITHQKEMAQQSDIVKQLQSQASQQLLLQRQLKESYSELDAKYRRLIRPARSSLGKVVVTVRYQRRDGALQMAIQLPDKNGFHQVGSVKLHQQLAQLKEKLGSKLYVRILFPEDSGLSYNEAWRITESLLRLYDYYYRQ
ncbi:MAG: hypothetical protein R8J84_02395 [Mariprofundales bacterium]